MVRPSPELSAALALLLTLGCGGEPTARDLFVDTVVPVFDRSCGAAICHGYTAEGVASGEDINPDLFLYEVDDQGQHLDVEQIYVQALRIINTVEDPGFSSLVRKPLAEGYGGFPHHGGENFRTPTDGDLLAIEAWIMAEDAGGEDPEPLDAHEQLFADDVQPVLIGLGCASANCHGSAAAVPYRLQPGLDGLFDIASTRANYEASIHMLSLDGDPLQSRLLAKSLPLYDGGVVHRGGNIAFLRGVDDDRVAPITAWACEEREHRTGESCLEETDAPLSGVVALRGELTPQDPFGADDWSPGTELVYWPVLDGDLTAGDPVVLVGAEGDVDVRDPAVDPTGTQVAYSLRTSADTGHEIWILDLATGESTAITDDAGPAATGGMMTHRDPAWGPDGTLWYVSSRDGMVAESGQGLDLDIYQVDLDTGVTTRRSITPHIERKPTFYRIGEVHGEISFTTLRNTIRDQAVAHAFRFPPGLKTEYHQHFGVTAPEDLLWDTRELADGRYVSVLGDLDNVWIGGRLGVLDRNMGAEWSSEATWDTVALPNYTEPLVRLDADAASEGVTDRLYRDPAPLADGRVLVAVAEGPLDLADPEAEVQTAIAVLTLDEDEHGAGPELTDRTLWLSDATRSIWDPEPVMVTVPVPERPMKWDPEAETALLKHNGLPMIDAILANLFPAGPKTLRDDLVGVRVIESVPVGADTWFPVAAEETMFGSDDATSVGIGGFGPSRVLAQLPLAGDGTFQLAIPAGVAFRIQGLDDQGRAAGHPHNRWIDTHPGQVIPQGAPRHDEDQFYAARCAACHGSADGDPNAVFIAPDVMTTASVTLSRYEDQDPRRPIAATVAGDETRKSLDFQADVAPILAEHCASCHGGDSPAGGLDLEDTATTWFSVAYESLLQPGDESTGGRRYVAADDASARRSWLIEQLTGDELDAPGHPGSPGEPHVADLTADDLGTLVLWIDLGATWQGPPEETP